MRGPRPWTQRPAAPQRKAAPTSAAATLGLLAGAQQGGPQAATARKAPHEPQGLLIPAPAYLRAKNQEPLRPLSEQLRVRRPFPALSHPQGRSVLLRRPGLRGPRARQRRHKRGVAAECLPPRGNTVDDQVQAASVPRVDSNGRGVGKPLLRHHLTFWAHSFARHPHPGPLDNLRAPSEQTSPRASKGMIPESVSDASAAGPLTPASVGRDGQREPHPAPQRNLHGTWRQCGRHISQDGCQPGTSLSPRLGPEQRPQRRRQGRQEHAVAEVGVAYSRRVKLPAVRPVPKAYSLVVVLGARALQQVLPRWNSSPTFCLQLCSGRLRLPQARRTGPVRWGAELGDPRFREAGPARLYDGERVCPPRPIGRWRNARSGAQPQAAHGRREARDIPHIRETIGRRATQAPEQRFAFAFAPFESGDYGP